MTIIQKGFISQWKILVIKFELGNAHLMCSVPTPSFLSSVYHLHLTIVPVLSSGKVLLVCTKHELLHLCYFKFNIQPAADVNSKQTEMRQNWIWADRQPLPGNCSMKKLHSWRTFSDRQPIKEQELKEYLLSSRWRHCALPGDEAASKGVKLTIWSALLEKDGECWVCEIFYGTTFLNQIFRCSSVVTTW